MNFSCRVFAEVALSHQDVPYRHHNHYFYRESYEALSDCMLEQMVTSPTRGQNILDLFFTTYPTLVDDISVIPGLSDHDIVLAQVNVKPERTK